tara:strand:+ start:2973 stop:3509 length:537 start_codon:yes stop_codon:yes gene_type:complete
MPLTERPLYEILGKIQNELKTKKTRYNNFGKYYFRSAEDILESIKPFLIKYKVSVTIKEKLIGEYIIQSKAILTNGMNTIEATAIVGIEVNQKGMQMPQKFGTASSYGKKYALGNLFLIDDTADSDAINKHDKNLPTLYANTPQYNNAVDAMKNRKKTINDIKQHYIVSKEIEQKLLT